MSLTPSNMIALGTPAPEFSLPDVVSGKVFSLNQFQEVKAIVVMFLSNHCPYVKHVNSELVKLANEYIPKKVAFIAISSNDIKSYPDDSPEKMKEAALRLKYPFPFLYDESQDVAKAYDAACTPDFYIFTQDRRLAYRGQLDDSRPGNNISLSGSDIRKALDCILSGNVVSPYQRPSIGCNIKWKHTMHDL